MTLSNPMTFLSLLTIVMISSWPGKIESLQAAITMTYQNQYPMPLSLSHLLAGAYPTLRSFAALGLFSILIIGRLIDFFEPAGTFCCSRSSPRLIRPCTVAPRIRIRASTEIKRPSLWSPSRHWACLGKRHQSLHFPSDTPL